jgi:hypothetical protein
MGKNVDNATVGIKMLGNMWGYEVGKTYFVDEATANQLTGLGMAQLLPEAPASRED